jgi:hypothetical protein
MKNMLFMLALVVCSTSLHAQGTIFFNNRTSAGDYPVYLPDLVTGAGLIPGGASAQLYLVTSGGGALVPLAPATTFRTSSAAAALYVNPVDVTVPGILPGEPATIVMRVWASSYGSFDAAAVPGFTGESQQLTIAALGGVNPNTGAIVPTPDLAGLTSFILVPEPSTVSLALLGAVGMVMLRRRGISS